jgi:hypothetical protein
MTIDGVVVVVTEVVVEVYYTSEITIEGVVLHSVVVVVEYTSYGYDE